MLLSEVQERIADISLTQHKRLVNYVRQSHYSLDLAEECVQEAYLTAMEEAETIHSPDKLFSWLKTVATRKAQQNMRDYFRIANACFCNYYEKELSKSDPFLQIVVADTVARVLSRFPPHYAEILRLRYLNCYSFKQIGNALDLQPSAVRQAHFRIKSALKQAFNDLNN